MGVSPQLKFSAIPDEDYKKLDDIYMNLVVKHGILVDKDLFKFKRIFLVRHVKVGSYKGIRLFQGLPFRGQRTHTNASTAKRLHKAYVSQHLRGYVIKEKTQMKNEGRKKKIKK